MLNISNHEETISDFGDAVISEMLTTDKGDFSLYREYIGGYDEEEGAFDLEGAMGCYISLNETTGTEGHETIKALFDIFKDNGDEVSIQDSVVMISAPEIKQSLVIENFVSEEETIRIVDKIKKYFKKEGKA